MANATVSVTITIPISGASDQNDRAARNIALQALNQVEQAIGSTAAVSANILWPPGNNPQVIGSFTYSPPS